jgi:hypothetical protein
MKSSSHNFAYTGSVLICVGAITICVGTYSASVDYTITASSNLCLVLAACFWGMGIIMIRVGYKQLKTPWDHLQHDGKDDRSTEDRLDELERLKRRDMVTPEEYAAKRQEILKDL